MLALVFLAIGVLGLSGMQTISLVKSGDANEVSRMTVLGSEIIERIQYNRQNVASYNLIDTSAGTPCPMNATTQPMAAGDCSQWDSRVDNVGLSNAKGTVTVDSSAALGPAALKQNKVTVTLTWTGSSKSDMTVKRSRSLTMTTIVSPE
jgi:Tfp pilus assembly protein PilV